jgi:hypothetical protein
MNVREGMRRLGLVVGVLGAGAGTVVAYTQLQSRLAERAQYKTFQSLVSSTVVQKEIGFLKRNPVKPGAPNQQQSQQPEPAGGDWFQRNAPKPFVPPRPDQWEGPAPDYSQIAALVGSSNGWKVNKGGVRAIHFWGSTQEKVNSRLAGDVSAADISDIETDDGQKVYRTDPPGFRSYLLILVFPVVGFFLPWGALKTLTWIGLGFFQSEKREPPQAKE